VQDGCSTFPPGWSPRACSSIGDCPTYSLSKHGAFSCNCSSEEARRCLLRRRRCGCLELASRARWPLFCGRRSPGRKAGKPVKDVNTGSVRRSRLPTPKTSRGTTPGASISSLSRTCSTSDLETLPSTSRKLGGRFGSSRRAGNDQRRYVPVLAAAGTGAEAARGEPGTFVIGNHAPICAARTPRNAHI
jgi:hypothetical protein